MAEDLLVVGASGRTGSELVRVATRAGMPTRAASRRAPPAAPGPVAPSGPVSGPGQSADSPKAPEPRRVHLDIEDPSTFEAALSGVRYLFLLRPPQIAKVEPIAPFLDALAASSIERIVFMSVQGAERLGFLPHRKIEDAIRERSLPATLLRPAFFMDNLTTTHLDEIAENHELVAPAGGAEFNFVACSDIAAAAFAVFSDTSKRADAYTLTGPDNLTLGEVADKLSKHLPFEVSYRSPNPFRFFRSKRKAGDSRGFALTMTMLYAVQRFAGSPEQTPELEQLVDRPAMTLDAFIEGQIDTWTRSKT